MPNDGQTLLLDTENKLYHGVDINDANGKPKLKASPTLTCYLSMSPPYYINMSHPLDRKEAGRHWPDEDKGDAPKAKRRPHNGQCLSSQM